MVDRGNSTVPTNILKYVKGDDQLADLLTKYPPRAHFIKLRDGVLNYTI